MMQSRYQPTRGAPVPVDAYDDRFRTAALNEPIRASSTGARPRVRDAPIAGHENRVQDRSRSEHRDSLVEHRGAVQGTMAVPPGLERAGALTQLAGAMNNTVNLLAQLQSSIAQVASSAQPKQSKKDVFDEFKLLPEQVQKACLTHSRQLEDYLRKLTLHQRNADDRRLHPAKLHPRAESMRTAQWQISKEDLRFNSGYNIATQFDELRQRHAREFQQFVDDSTQHRITYLTGLCKREDFVIRVKTAVAELKLVDSGVFNAEEAIACDIVIAKWSDAMFQKCKAASEAQKAVRADKKAKYDKKRAEGEARLQQLSPEEMVFAGILEASRLVGSANLLNSDKPADILNNKKTQNKIADTDILG
eukprot:TRINITY_DN28455_c1_g3_i1.p1 TRINITY_DN28455_c1_g3~~TRINITY_DN28455_c1_g3_i1.p1  ORF type:complete len:362 (-),score=70.28 TRINITY_DN28455_c1_g3_i1:1536-2621(-)